MSYKEISLVKAQIFKLSKGFEMQNEIKNKKKGL